MFSTALSIPIPPAGTIFSIEITHSNLTEDYLSEGLQSEGLQLLLAGAAMHARQRVLRLG
jgi:hypothetical protein